MMEEEIPPEEEKLVEEDVLEAKTESQAFPKGDLILVVEGKELYVNKDILMEASPVFRAMLESDFKESTQGRIELPGKSYEAMVEFLKCTYTFINSYITVNNVFKILPLAEEYQTSLKKRCDDFMINILRAKENYFIYRTDIFENNQLGCEKENPGEKTSLLIKYHSDVPKATNRNDTPSPFFSYGQQPPSRKFGNNFATPTVQLGFSLGGSAFRLDSKPDATNVDEFNNIGFGKNGFEVGNTVPAEIVIEYILEAEKYGCNDFLKIAIQYVAMRQFSHFETAEGFSDISVDTRFKITMLRLRILENYQSNGLDVKDLLLRK